jgi:hypothetical protein
MTSKHKKWIFEKGIFEGYYFSMFEVSGFSPIGIEEHWWLIGDGYRHVTTLIRTKEVPNPCYLQVEGLLSEKGRWGHLGQYDRELKAMKVIAYGIDRVGVQKINLKFKRTVPRAESQSRPDGEVKVLFTDLVFVVTTQGKWFGQEVKTWIQVGTQYDTQDDTEGSTTKRDLEIRAIVDQFEKEKGKEHTFFIPIRYLEHGEVFSLGYDYLIYLQEFLDAQQDDKAICRD